MCLLLSRRSRIFLFFIFIFWGAVGNHVAMAMTMAGQEPIFGHFEAFSFQIKLLHNEIQ
jgi:hypothetical protein